MRWSRLKKLLEEIFDPDLDMLVFCTAQRGERGVIGRYWFVQDGKTIWDEPKNVSRMLRENESSDAAPIIGSILRRYLETPKDDLLDLQFPEDIWGLCDLLKAADRRIGKRRLIKLKEATQNQAALALIELRLKAGGE